MSHAAGGLVDEERVSSPLDLAAATGVEVASAVGRDHPEQTLDRRTLNGCIVHSGSLRDERKRIVKVTVAAAFGGLDRDTTFVGSTQPATTITLGM